MAKSETDPQTQTTKVPVTPSPSGPPPRQTLERGKLITLAFIVLLSTSFGFLGGWYGSRNRTPTLSEQKQVISSESNLISQIASEVGPSVVSVNVTTTQASRSVFSQGSTEEAMGAGTGFIVSEDGIVVTNRHVVPSGTTKVELILSDGTKLDQVEIIGRTNDSDPLDVAFLKIKDAKGQKLKPAKLGDSTQMKVGDKVVAIGNALGQFQNTVTAGIISGYGRSVEAGDESGTTTESLQDLFQTDAAINQGNSGGPLVNINGEVIGINTAVAGDAQNIGFAIPIANVKNLIDGVVSSGKLERPYLGVRYISITDDYAAANNLSVKRGAYIVPGSDAIVAGSPAAAAGLKPGDIITKVDNTKIDENNSLSTVLGRFKVGQQVTLTVIRDGQEQAIKVNLSAAPQN